ncbi:MAG: TolC family protein [Planctomycetes bacterium]|nr:TolC family protein [Planctomycetota bacterium]
MMKSDNVKGPAVLLPLWLLMGLLWGCGDRDHARIADRDAYQILDDKWDASFGSQSNYRIMDTPALPGDVTSDRSLSNYGTLTLPKSVALATAHNHLYQRQREALYRQALDLRLSRHEFENLFFGGGGAGLHGNDRDEVLGAEANIGVNRLLYDGTRIGARVTLAWIDILSGNLWGGLTSILGVTVVKPLLRGASRDLVMEGLTQAERDTLYEIRRFNRFRKTFVVGVITEYYRILLLGQRATHAEENAEALRHLHDWTQKLVAAGRIPLHESNRIHQEVLQAQDAQLNAQRLYAQALDAFRVTLNLSGTARFRLDEEAFTTLQRAQMVLPAFDEREVIAAALSRRLDLANLADQVIDAERKVAVAEDQLRPELNLVAGTALPSSKLGDRARLQPYENEYGLGLEVDLPFDRLAEETVHRKTQIALMESRREYEEHSNLIAVEIRKAHRDLTEARDRHSLQTESLSLVEKRLAGTTRLLKLSRISTRRVLRSLEDLHQAKDADAEALVNYAVAALNFYRDTGILKVQPDGMWKL